MDQRQFFLRDILSVIFKHKALILLFPAVVFFVVFVANYVWPPTYESEARIRLMRGREVSQADTTVTQSSDTITMIQMGIEDVNSEIELLHSADLLERVVLAMGFDKDPNFPYSDWVFHQPSRALRYTINGILYTLNLKNRPDNLTIAIDELRDRIITQPIRDSHVLEVRLRMGTAQKAQEILQEILKHYKDFHIEVFANDRSVPFFTQQRERVEQALLKAQAELQEFRKSANISLLTTEEELLLQQYADGRRVLSQLAEISAVVGGDLDSSVIASLSGQTDSTVVREMQLRLLELLLEQNRIVQSLGPRHPQVISIKEQVRIAQNNLIEAIANVKRVTESKMESLQARLNALGDTKARLQKLEQDGQILSEQYEYYSQKLEEARVADELAAQSISNVRIVSSPSRPIDPIVPSKLMNLALAIVGGILGALALAFLLDYLDHGLKTPEDVEYYTRLSPLASFWKAAGARLDSREAERLAVMLDAGRGGDSQVLEVTSAVNGEGAPAVAAALADAFAGSPDVRALLLDFTGDAPGVRPGPGLADVLLGSASVDSVFTTGDRLTVVGRGTQADSYLWGSRGMDDLVAELRRRYQYVVLSVGPILQSHDAIKLARHADGLLIVIKADSTRREVVSRAVETLKDAKPKVIGAVLTERTQNIPQAVYRRI